MSDHETMTEAAHPNHPSEIDISDAGPRRWGWWLLTVGFGGFLAWAVTAPLDGGVSASGMVVVTGNRKAVQAVSGGKVRAILAKDGDVVSAGQVLVQLDDTQSRSQLDVVKGQWLAGMAAEARLKAERTGRSSLEFPAALNAEKADSRVAGAMGLQSHLFSTRRESLANELAAMTENIRGLELQAGGAEASRRAKEDQLRLLREQLKNLRELSDEGFLPRNRVLDQERTIASIVGAVAEDAGSIGHYRQSIAEVKARRAAREQDARKEVETQLVDTQRELASLVSRLEGLQFDVVNTEIKSPAAGVVMNLAVHTVGGVVSAGSPLMEVVPGDELLKIEAQIPPHLIDKVKLGLPVDIVFSAFNQAKTPHIPGRLVWVSADVLLDPKQSVPYFKALVEVTPEGMVKLQANEIRAGMPAEVFVRTGTRTAMNYLLKPLLDRLNRALTEP